ncbi:SDR family oxidoreductase [Streptomyces specialis]|uniref:SDR family oxidoreductase n=1 Tax=Streptomyces specialis TaxID=498367 RepID=UPI00073F20E3|nr:SDR family oxidoreductase [Streptomyces specialis]
MNTTEALRRRTVTSGDVSLAVYEQGDPAHPTVLLVHGYPDTHQVWDDVAADLAADHHVVRYDVRGAGDSDRPARRDDYALEALARDLFAVAEATSPGRPVHVVAHDWGSIQSWEAVTDSAAPGRIASYTSLSGPCLDHVAHWMRDRYRNPTPRHVAQLLNQAAHSWYIAAFHVPALAPAVWRLGLAKRWGTVLHKAEGVRPRPGHPQPGLAADAVHGIELYRANMLPRLRAPRSRPTPLPVQLITLSKDHYVSPALAEGAAPWAPNLWRRTIPATHWSALLNKGATVARMVREFVGHHEGAPAAPQLDRARRRRDADETRPVSGPLAVVTGAGSGIGRATALAFAEQGADVVVCDIDAEAAERTAELARLLGADAAAYRVDVSDGPAVDAFATEVAARHGVPDIVVNNAGVGHAGSFLETTEKEWQRVLDVNLWGVIHGCRAFGALLAARDEGGHIVNIASAAAYLPSRALAAYGTSKAAVVSLSESLRAELAGAGVGVTAICPGVVKTNIPRTTTFSGGDGAEQDERRRRAARAYARRNYPPEKVADRILRAVRDNRAVVPVTPEARAGYLLGRVSPGLLRRAARFLG